MVGEPIPRRPHPHIPRALSSAASRMWKPGGQRINPRRGWPDTAVERELADRTRLGHRASDCHVTMMTPAAHCRTRLLGVPVSRCVPAGRALDFSGSTDPRPRRASGDRDPRPRPPRSRNDSRGRSSSSHRRVLVAGVAGGTRTRPPRPAPPEQTHRPAPLPQPTHWHSFAQTTMAGRRPIRIAQAGAAHPHDRALWQLGDDVARGQARVD